MKKLALILAIIMCCACISGCSPKITEETVIAYYGEQGAFYEGVKLQAEQYGLDVELLTDIDAILNGTDTPKVDILIAYNKDVVFGDSDVKKPIVITCGGANDCSAAEVDVAVGDMSKEALDVLFNYPAHESPIRALGVFESADSAAAKEYSAMISAGKIYDKGQYTGSGDAKEWTANSLSKVIPGLLDTIYADNEKLAIQAYDALRAADRNDAVEIISNGISSEVVNAMLEDHFSMGAAVGANLWSAGALSFRMALQAYLENEVQDYSYSAITVYSDDVLAACKDGGMSVAEYMVSLDTAALELYVYAEAEAQPTK